MISIRTRVILIIVSIVIIITLSSLALGLLFNHDRFQQTIRQDLMVIAQISEQMLSNEINLLKEEVRSVAEQVNVAVPEDKADVLEQEGIKSRFQSITVLDIHGRSFHYGPPGLKADEYTTNYYARRALAGETVLGTTVRDSNGDLVIRIWTPVKNGIMAATLPGLFFCNSVQQFTIWKTGGLYIINTEGTMVAHMDSSVVLKQQNYVASADNDPAFKSAGDFFRTMLDGGSGVGTYTFLGRERLCAYIPIRGSDGFVLGATAPSDESPLARVDQVIFISAFIFLGLGVITAFITANNVATPFEYIKKQNIQLAELMKTAKSASEAKSHFLANMSHEMRTPLNAIIGLSELELGAENLSGTAYENIEKIYISGMTLLGIINDILDISKIESGKFSLIPVEYELPSLINDTVNLNMVRIGSKSIAFNLHIDPALPLRLVGDELRIKQIFNNLLSNAFKYTESGTVDWYISCEVEGNSVWLASSVRDTGIGIAAENLSRLFTDYNQVDTKSTRKIEGTGLGLSITKNLVELMDGEITVESEPGKGSIFSMRIRQQYVNDVVIGEEMVKNLTDFRYTANRRFRNEKLARCYIPYATVLVVDDVAINLDVARGLLKPYGMTVDCVNSGQEAIDLVREGKPKYNAIFMDHMMPEMDGFEAVQIIRNEIGSEYAKTVPIIALTANAIIGNEELFLKNGFQAFLPKPIDIINLDTVINRYVRNRALEKELSYTETVARQDVQEIIPGANLFEGKSLEGINFTAGLRRFDNDEETYLHLLKSYCTLIRSIPEKLRAHTPETLPDYAIAIHSLKSTSYTIGANRIGERAEDLEAAANSGDLEFINTHNNTLITALEDLARKLETFLEEIRSKNKKPVRQAPDPALLTQILAACRTYDMEQLDAAMDQLEAYDYENQAELVEWLRKQIDTSELEAIRERLSRTDNDSIDNE